MISHKCPICEIMADFLKSKNKSRLDLRFQTKLEKVDAKGGHQTLELVVFFHNYVSTLLSVWFFTLKLKKKLNTNFANYMFIKKYQDFVFLVFNNTFREIK